MEWKKIPLGDTATFYNGYAFKPSDWSSKGKEIIRIQNLTKGAATINYFEGTLSERYKVRKGDILISWSATLGVYEWNKEDAWLNQHLFKVVLDKEDLNKSFFKYLIKIALKKLESQVHGATMKHITKKKFDAFPVILPPLAEQKRIAKILDQADQLRQLNQQILAEYDALTKSLFLDMFGDPVVNPMGWEKKSVISYCSCIVPGRDKPKSFTGEIPWVTTADLNHLEFTFVSKKNIGLTKKEVAEVRAKMIPKESVIMTCVGDLGVITINKQEVVVNQQLHAFQCSEKINNIFLMYNLSYQTPYMNKMASSTTVPYMNKTVANNTPTILPPIALQNKFAQKIKNIEAQKAKAQAALAASEDLFNNLLQKAFKGEL